MEAGLPRKLRLKQQLREKEKRVRQPTHQALNQLKQTLMIVCQIYEKERQAGKSFLAFRCCVFAWLFLSESHITMYKERRVMLVIRDSETRDRGIVTRSLFIFFFFSIKYVC